MSGLKLQNTGKGCDGLRWLLIQCRKKAGVKFALPAEKHHPATRVGEFYAGVIYMRMGSCRGS